VEDLFEEADKPLPGKRVSILELQKELTPDDVAPSASEFDEPESWRNEFWPQEGGYPNHSMQHLALSEKKLERQWSVNIGRGASSRLPLTAQPIIVQGKAYTLDTASSLSAFDIQDGSKLWEASLRPEGEDDPVIGGGMAYSGGLLFVTTGYNEVIALGADNGEIKWRKSISAPARAAPTVYSNRLFVTTLDNRVLALETADGSIIWEHAALGENIGLVGAASPAANQDVVIPAFSSGEIFALRVENGSVAWSDNLSPLRSYGGLAGLSDITASPVMDKELVIAVSFGGRIVAINVLSGSRIWQKEIGSSETPWVAGNMIFVTSSNNKLVALLRDSGNIIWVADLNRDRDEKVMWTSPVFAGGRLVLASSGGDVAEYSPENGKLIRSWRTTGAVSMPPVVAREMLYFLTDSGRLVAYK
jgi:outer membrane protein assembly factor BamB